jgi:hypothetical protein
MQIPRSPDQSKGQNNEVFAVFNNWTKQTEDQGSGETNFKPENTEDFRSGSFPFLIKVLSGLK